MPANRSGPCLLLICIAPYAPAAELGPWSVTTSAMERSGPTLPGFAMGNFLYAFYDDSATIQRAERIGPDGALGPWTNHANQAYRTRWGIPTVVVGEYVYAVGDWGRVRHARQASDGALTPWTNAINGGESMTDPGRGLLWGAATSHRIGERTYLYHLCGFEYVGDWEPRFVQDCFYSYVLPDGMLYPWAQTATAPQGLMSPTALAASNGYLYLIGGGIGTFETTTGPVTDAIVVARINPDGSLSSWTTLSRRLRQAVRGALAFEHDGELFIAGGLFAGSGRSTLCYKATLNTDGSLGEWIDQPSLPEGTGITPRGRIGDHVYFMGANTSGPAPVYVAPLSVPTPTPTPISPVIETH